MRNQLSLAALPNGQNPEPIPGDRIQANLLAVAGVFLAFISIALTLSPAARARTWNVNFRWDHWLGFGIWFAFSIIAHRQSVRFLPNRDPYLLPIACLLSGWGLLTIWRLFPGFGLRQGLWFAASMSVLIVGFRLPTTLQLLRRYKYLWLTSGLLLTALTLIFGANPSGGILPRLWLGCCGVYLQPSELLKLLLIMYLAAYLADQLLDAPANTRALFAQPLLPLLAPTLVMTGLALLLLLAQRDLGTASIFLFLYACIVYIASQRKGFLLLMALVVFLAGSLGYYLFDVVRIRIEAWLNPWLDPSGRSFQIVQSLMAVANGGLFGRGPGLGNPGLVPIPHSDFIFTSIAEEYGLIGAAALLLLLSIFAVRGIRIAIYASDVYRRYLAAGLTAHLVAQSILIIGGNLRLLPLTGVTLPFVSYGGSSLFVSILSLLILLTISGEAAPPPPSNNPIPYQQLGSLLLAGLGALSLAIGWWAFVRSPTLLNRTDNARRTIADRYVKRGSILDRNNSVISQSTGNPGELYRQILSPDLSNIIGYTDPAYGQAGLEASMDTVLRGLRGNSTAVIWWNHILYGQPPTGLDVRTSLDLDLQNQADQLLGEHTGAIVLINASSGEILAMASHPTFNANKLAEEWPSLVQDPTSRFLNRATQGLYPVGAALGPEIYAAAIEKGIPLSLPLESDISLNGKELKCAVNPAGSDWGQVLSAGCPGAVKALGKHFDTPQLQEVYNDLGISTIPEIQLPASPPEIPSNIIDPESAAIGNEYRVSPLQMALAAATISGQGIRPSARLILAVQRQGAEWTLYPERQKPKRAFSPEAANTAAVNLGISGEEIWQNQAVVPASEDTQISWYTAGSLPTWKGTPVTIVVLLEEENVTLAKEIGLQVLKRALFP